MWSYFYIRCLYFYTVCSCFVYCVHIFNKYVCIVFVILSTFVAFSQIVFALLNNVLVLFSNMLVSLYNMFVLLLNTDVFHTACSYFCTVYSYFYSILFYVYAVWSYFYTTYSHFYTSCSYVFLAGKSSIIKWAFRWRFFRKFLPANFFFYRNQETTIIRISQELFSVCVY